MSAQASHQEIYRRGAAAPTSGMVAVGAILAVVGLGLFIVLANGADPDRAWRAYHVNFLFFTAMSMGAVIFAATQRVTKGVWAGPIIRFAEAAAGFLPAR